MAAKRKADCFDHSRNKIVKWRQRVIDEYACRVCCVGDDGVVFVAKAPFQWKQCVQPSGNSFCPAQTFETCFATFFFWQWTGIQWTCTCVLNSYFFASTTVVCFVPFAYVVEEQAYVLRNIFQLFLFTLMHGRVAHWSILPCHPRCS